MFTDEVVGPFTQERAVLSDELRTQALGCGIYAKVLNQLAQHSFHVVFLLTLILRFDDAAGMRGEERGPYQRGQPGNIA